MKVKRAKVDFNPVVITLETQSEVSTLWYILNSVGEGRCPTFTGCTSARMVRDLLKALLNVEFE